MKIFEGWIIGNEIQKKQTKKRQLKNYENPATKTDAEDDFFTEIPEIIFLH